MPLPCTRQLAKSIVRPLLFTNTCTSPRGCATLLSSIQQLGERNELTSADPESPTVRQPLPGCKERKSAVDCPWRNFRRSSPQMRSRPQWLRSTTATPVSSAAAATSSFPKLTGVPVSWTMWEHPQRWGMHADADVCSYPGQLPGK